MRHAIIPSWAYREYDHMTNLILMQVHTDPPPAKQKHHLPLVTFFYRTNGAADELPGEALTWASMRRWHAQQGGR